VTIVEFLIPRRPLSLQTRRRNDLQSWKRLVAGAAGSVWGRRAPIESGDLRLTIVYLSDEYPPDTDNIIKPIQDALEGVVIVDDLLVTDVQSHRRFRKSDFDLTRLPPLLHQGLLIGAECVYVRLGETEPLEDLL
jgi:hypothetical protein